MNNQDVFNTVWQWFVTDGNPRAVVNGRCMYRTADGRKCAIGCCIPDELYESTMDEIGGVTNLFHHFPDLEADLFGGCEREFLINLQAAHDYSLVEDLEPGFIKLAKEYELNIPRVNSG